MPVKLNVARFSSLMARGLVAPSTLGKTSSGLASWRCWEAPVKTLSVGGPGLFGGSSSLCLDVPRVCGRDLEPLFRWWASSVKARHNSVRFLQILSAFFRSCRSVTVLVPPAPMVLAPLEMGPGWPTVPISWANDRASAEAASMASKTSELTNGFVLERADLKSGWPCCEDAVLGTSVGAVPTPDARFGEPEMVVAPVPAVGGRSSEALDMAAPEVLGIFPVNSNR